jgi:hypothetical protein
MATYNARNGGKCVLRKKERFGKVSAHYYSNYITVGYE